MLQPPVQVDGISNGTRSACPSISFALQRHFQPNFLSIGNNIIDWDFLIS